MNTEFAITLDWRSDQRTPLRWVFSHLLRSKLLILIVIVGAFGNAALAAAVPLYTGIAFDAILKLPPDLATVGAAALAIVISQAVRGVLQFGRNYGNEIIGQRLERDARAELYTSLLGKSMTFHDRQSTGDIMARATNDVREMNLMLNPGINLVIGSAMFLVVPILAAPRIHPQLILVPLLFCAGYFLALWRFLVELRPVTERVRRRFGGMNAILAETIEGIETVKGAAKEEYEIARFDEGATAYRDAFVRQGDIEARFVPLLLMGLATGAGLFQALALYRVGEISVGDIVAYMGLLGLFGFPTFISLFAYAQISTGFASARRILELIHVKTELDENKEGHAAPMQGAIRFEHVSFFYRGKAQAVEDVSFEVRPGQTLAIVGQTGSGKSTIIKLINRIYDANAGRVLIDGVDVRDWNLESLRRQISIIEQDLFLFSRTIAENIAFGCPGATREEIERAAQEAQAHEFITSFADGYDTVVGERGVTLSGGQRQRIAIARAFLTDPRILILDDSTSAIDSATEDQIQQAIERASQNRTTILITHRLSQIRWADVILVMRNGRVAAIGTHEELMRTSESYRRIFARYE
ncbi:MAG TPA: ABC transporter ATP-binding protein [Anaerolineae bacterium]|nr:ABC transporter ATP-binding protein [Anaerolineae bacterium]